MQRLLEIVNCELIVAPCDSWVLENGLVVSGDTSELITDMQIHEK